MKPGYLNPSSIDINLINPAHLKFNLLMCAVPSASDTAKHHTAALYLRVPRFRSWPEGWLCGQIFFVVCLFHHDRYQDSAFVWATTTSTYVPIHYSLIGQLFGPV